MLRMFVTFTHSAVTMRYAQLPYVNAGLAEQGSLQSELSPCYLNRIDVTETAVGWGKYIFELLRKFINNYSPFARGYPLELINCIAPPTKEYIFPRDLYPYE